MSPGVRRLARFRPSAARVHGMDFRRTFPAWGTTPPEGCRGSVQNALRSMRVRAYVLVALVMFAAPGLAHETIWVGATGEGRLGLVNNFLDPKPARASTNPS